MPTLAYATGIAPFLDDAVLDPSVASKFPGASVWPEVNRAAQERGWAFSTADVVLGRVHSGDLHARDVLLIQEENSELGTALLEAGAQPSLLLCGESPLFARDFYSRIGEISSRFDNVLLFRGALNDVPESVGKHTLHFPSFHRGPKAPLQSWDERHAVVMVAGNKYWRHEGLPMVQRLKRVWEESRHHAYFTWLRRHQLHDQRLSYVVDLLQANLLTLYGPGWDSLAHLPLSWQRNLRRTGADGRVLDYAAKQSTVGGFKFALTLENFEYPGYVTEKIVDALAAGAIPLYLGAPDIDDFIPSEAFVDLRQFPTTGDLVEFLRGVDAQSGMAMIEEGQRFLSSAAGDVFTYQYQGDYIVSLATAPGV